MEQFNRRTTETKPAPIFTTNGYLYKTHLHPIYAKPQEQNTGTKNNIHQKTTNFEELLIQSIDEGLSVIGESAKKVVYAYLEKTFKMNRLDIPHRIEEFTKAIESIFGNGAKIFEIQIMKSLFNKVGYTVKQYSGQKNLTFIEYIAAIKREQKNHTNTNKQQPNYNRKQNGQKQQLHENAREKQKPQKSKYIFYLQ